MRVLMNEKSLFDTVYNNLKIFSRPKFKVHFRIRKYKHLFEKVYTPNWIIEIFEIKTITNKNPNTCILEMCVKINLNLTSKDKNRKF